MVNSYIAKKDLDSEMTVVRNEFEMGENDPGAHPRGARPLDRVPLAQLRQVHDRRRVRHRERADRPAAGLLPDVLPARQRGARSSPASSTRRRRSRSSTRPSAGSRSPRARCRRPTRSSRRRTASARSRCGAWATSRRSPPRTTCRPARTPTPPRSTCSTEVLTDTPVGPAVQGARRDEEGHVGRRLLHGAPRSRASSCFNAEVRAGPVRSTTRRRRCSRRSTRAASSHADHEGGGRPRPRDAPQEHRPDAQQRRPRRPAALRIHRPGRLAALLPQPRPHPQGHGRGRAARGARRTSSPPTAPSASSSRRPSPTAPRSRRRPTSAGAGQGLQGRRRDRRRRGVRPLAGQHRVAHQALGAARAA